VSAAILAHRSTNRCHPDNRVIAATALHVVGRSSGASCVGMGMADPNPAASRVGPTLPEIQHALDEQYTDAVRDLAHRFAERRAALVRKAGWPVPTPKDYAKELVHDAYVAVWSGLRAWDPLRMPLASRLCWLIMDRTWREIVQAKRRREEVNFDLAANDPKIGIEAALARDSAGSVRDDAQMEIVALFRRVVLALLDLARKDEQARAVLRCWAQGFLEPDDICALTQMTTAVFLATRKRILRLSKRLPPELYEAAQDLLRRVS